MPATSSTALASPLRPRRKGEITAERILDAAEDLFGERGYKGTTLRDVAQRVGLRIPSLYNHFPSKDSLYAAVLERGIGPVLRMLSQFVEPGGPARPDSRQILESVLELLAHHPNLARLVQHETLSGGQRLTPLLRDWIEPLFERAREVAAASPGSDRWDEEQLPLLVLAMYHIVVGYFAIAPFYAELNGENLLAKRALERQKRFLIDLTETLFPEGTR